MANEVRLIDANELIKKREEMWQDRCDHMVVRVTNIENAPTVDAVEVVHGRWIGGYSKTTYIVPMCSRCGYGNSAVGMSNYCPNCGAKMDGERREGE